MRIQQLLPRAFAIGIVIALEVVPKFCNWHVGTKRDDASLAGFFENEVRPILVSNCYNCHSVQSNKAAGGFRVDDVPSMIIGGNRGAAIIPGVPERSLLIQVVKHSHRKVKMPPGKTLTSSEIDTLVQWVADGAVGPKPDLPHNFGRTPVRYQKQRKEHWAFQAVQSIQVPQPVDTDWPYDDIDRFVFTKLAENSLSPVKDADKLSLLRRVTFDLTGAPPTPAAVVAFNRDSSFEAYARLVDGLLESPSFGERWARHWLDLARYGESTGSSRNVPVPNAWRYRDYVINSFNRDVPYNRFLVQQIAGDLLKANDSRDRDDNVIATGFLALGAKDLNQQFRSRFVMDNVDEQIDTVTRTILALTVSCARCHDHKVEPIPMSDYYALAGIFTSTDLCAGLKNVPGGTGLDFFDPLLLLPLANSKRIDQDTIDRIAEAAKSVEIARQELEAVRDNPASKGLDKNGKPRPQYANKLSAAQAEYYALCVPVTKQRLVVGVRDSENVADTELRIRGQVEQLGPLVKRGFLTAFVVAGAAPVNSSQSGRLELATWLSSEHNPLTARVAVNRIWRHLFGRGIVPSVDNFGLSGDKPTHPELLDYLATRFVDGGWSVKRLIRALVMSHTYRLSSDSCLDCVLSDPDNDLLWRHSPRRLDAEEIRDAMLVAGDVLDKSTVLVPEVRNIKVVELRDNGPQARVIEGAAAACLQRSIYLPLSRGLVPRSLEVFDFANQGLVTGQRDSTNVVSQSLYLLNDPFVRKQSLAFAKRLMEVGDESNRIQFAYCIALGRNASRDEVDQVKSYVAEYVQKWRDSFPLKGKGGANESASRREGRRTIEPSEDPNNADQADEPIPIVAIRIADAHIAAWTSVCHTLLASAEFRFLK